MEIGIYTFPSSSMIPFASIEMGEILLLEVSRCEDVHFASNADLETIVARS